MRVPALIATLLSLGALTLFGAPSGVYAQSCTDVYLQSHGPNPVAPLTLSLSSPAPVHGIYGPMWAFSTGYWIQFNFNGISQAATHILSFNRSAAGTYEFEVSAFLNNVVVQTATFGATFWNTNSPNFWTVTVPHDAIRVTATNISGGTGFLRTSTIRNCSYVPFTPTPTASPTVLPTNTPTPTLTPTPTPTAIPLPTLYYPLRGFDGRVANIRLPDGVFGDYDNQRALHTYGDARNLVRAAQSGVVTQVTRFTGNLCETHFGRALPTQANVLIGGCVVPYEPNNDTIGLPVGPVFLDSDAAHLVTILGPEGYESRQLVVGARDYVQEGQQVSAGCWLGHTLQFAPPRGTITAAQLRDGVGAGNHDVVATTQNRIARSVTLTWVHYNGDFVDGWDLYQSPPQTDRPCSTPPQLEQCIGDAQLQDRGQWTLNAAASWNTPRGVTLTSGGVVAALMNLDPSRNPRMIVRGSGTAAAGFQLQLGWTIVETGSVTLDSQNAISIPPGPHQPNNAGFYTVSVNYRGNTSARIDSICVQMEDQPVVGTPTPTPTRQPTNTPFPTPTINPSAQPTLTPMPTRWPTPAPEWVEVINNCVFINHSFDIPHQAWEVVNGYWVPGAVRMRSGGILRQSIMVTNPGDYVATIRLRPLAIFTVSSPPPLWLLPLDVVLNGALSNALGPLRWSQSVTLVSDREQVITQDIEMTTGVNEYELRFDILELPQSYWGPNAEIELQIESICLSRAQTPSPATSCESEISPQQDGFAWLWGQLDRFFQCQLMPVLVDIQATIRNLYEAVAWSIRWHMLLLEAVFEWVGGQLVPWLNAHFANIARGTVTIIDQSGNCSDLFCVMSQFIGGFFDTVSQAIAIFETTITTIISPIADFLLMIIGGFVGLVFDVMIALINVAFAIMALVVAAVGQAVSIMQALFSAFTTTQPITIQGLPNCGSNPQGNGWCIALWTMEHTVFSGRGALLIPLVLGISYALALIRLAKTIRATMIEMSKVS